MPEKGVYRATVLRKTEPCVLQLENKLVYQFIHSVVFVYDRIFPFSLREEQTCAIVTKKKRRTEFFLLQTRVRIVSYV